MCGGSISTMNKSVDIGLRVQLKKMGQAPFTPPVSGDPIVNYRDSGFHRFRSTQLTPPASRRLVPRSFLMSSSGNPIPWKAGFAISYPKKF